jgi:hypothetical protein
LSKATPAAAAAILMTSFPVAIAVELDATSAPNPQTTQILLVNLRNLWIRVVLTLQLLGIIRRRRRYSFALLIVCGQQRT